MFLDDAQLPPRLARQLTAAGYPATHICDRLSPTAKDVDIAELANALGAVVVSKDEDFIDLLGRKVLRTGLLWIRYGNIKPADLWALLAPQLPAISQLLRSGQDLVKVPAAR